MPNDAGTTQTCSRESLEAAIELLPAVVLLIAPDNNRILGANAASFAAFGYDRAELLGCSAQQLVTPESQSAFAAQMVSCSSATGEARFETTFRRKDGTVRRVEVSARCTTIGSDRIVLGIVREIAYRTQQDGVLLPDSHEPEQVTQAPEKGRRWDEIPSKCVDFATRLEASLSERLALLLAATPETIDSQIVEAQRELCLLLGMDRSAIWQGSTEAPDTLRLTHLCTLDEIPPVPEGITANAAFPWITRQLLAGKTVAIPDIMELPPDAAVDQESLIYYLDKSTLAIPFVQRFGATRGAISFAATTRRERWSEDVLVHCRLISLAICSVLARTQANQDLAASEELYRSLINHLNVGVVLSEPDGPILHVNPMMLSLSGYDSADELRALPRGDLWAEFDARQRFMDVLKRKGRVNDVEATLRRKDGAVCPVSISAVVISDRRNRSDQVLGTIEDITERKLAEQRLRETESRLRSISSNFVDGMFYQVVVLRDGTRKFTYLSDSVKTLYGISPDEGIADASQVYSRVHEDDAKRLTMAEDDAVRSLTTFKAEVRVKGPSGAIRWSSFVSTPRVLDDGSSCWDGIEFVITERKRAEVALQESEARLKEAQRIAHVGNWELDLTDHTLVWSDETHRIFEIDREEFGASYVDFLAAIHPEDRDIVDRAYRNTRVAREPYEITYRLAMRDGRIKHVQERGITLFNPQDKPLRSIGTVQDITDRRRLEEQLGQSQKMDAIGSLAGGIAHDFNNLLSVILNYVECIKHELPADGSLMDDLAQVENAAQRAVALTRQLLAFSRKQVLQPVPLNLNQVAIEVEKMLRRIIGEDIEFVQVLAPDLGVIYADPGQLEQVLMNLAVNSRDAMPKGGRLTIETSNVYLDEEFAAGYKDRKPGPYVRLVVSDTGCGMDEKTKARVFEPFFTTKEMGKGTGLGLSMVYGIVNQSGGTISVCSQLGEGTAFTIHMPRTISPSTASARLREPARKRRDVNETILLVEDEAALLKVTQRTLEAIGYQVLPACNGDEAILVSAQHQGKIDLLLTDVVLPQMSGRALAERLASSRPTMKVLYMSGYTDDAIVHHGVIDAGLEFLGKPFATVQLMRKVEEVLLRDTSRT